MIFFFPLLSGGERGGADSKLIMGGRAGAAFGRATSPKINFYLKYAGVAEKEY